MSADQAKVCRDVADIIDFRSGEFEMGWWEYSPDTDNPECKTTACIGGHVGLLHNDAYNSHHFAHFPMSEWEEEWIDRQAGRLGLDSHSANLVFGGHAVEEQDLAKMLRAIGEYVEQSAHEYQITPLELRHIICEEGLEPSWKMKPRRTRNNSKAAPKKAAVVTNRQ